MTHLALSPGADPLAPSPEVARTALEGVFRILTLWGVGNEDARVLLGSPSESTLYAWRRGDKARLSADTLRRIGYLAGIYKALQIVYSDATLADSWVKRCNRHFGGRSALDRMLGGDVTDLAAVRAYLDAARAPWS